MLFFCFALKLASAQTISDLSVLIYAPTDTVGENKMKIDVVAKFTCTDFQDVDFITLKIGNGPGQADISTRKVELRAENGNYYTMNGSNVYKVFNSKLMVRSEGIKFTDLIKKYITVSVTYKNGQQSPEISKQYQ